MRKVAKREERRENRKERRGKREKGEGRREKRGEKGKVRRKKGTLFSQGMRRYVDKSIDAMRSRYPLALFEMSNSFEYI